MTVGTVEKRRRGTTAPPPSAVSPARGWIWAVVQLAILATEIFASLLVLAQPAFRPSDVRISGIHHVTSGDVNAALDLPQERTIFFLDRTDLERRVETLPWVQSAAVTLALPDRVSIQVTEWRPSAVLQIGESSYYLNDLGKVLDPASEAGPLAIVNRPDLARVKSGETVVSPELLPALLQLRGGFRPAFRVSITSFTIDGRNVLSAQTDRGWTVIFGQMLTSDDRATLEPKLAALRALSSRLDLTSGQIFYINLENPGAPAVQMRGRR
jgi:cell division protein FtsQ